MIATRLCTAAVVVALVSAVAGQQGAAQGTGKSCTYHPADGDPVKVADGDTYTPPGPPGRSRTFILVKYQCKNGKLVKVE
jgi:hypothetical protein